MTEPRRIAVADCETDPFKKGRLIIEPFIWGFYDGETYEEFTDTADFIKYVSERRVIVYAHNGGKFDWHFVVPWINGKVKVINGRLSEFRIGEAIFRDSFNILPTALKAFSKQDFDYTKLERDVRASNMEEIRRYLYSDCINLYNYIDEFFSQYPKALTLAGIAFKEWQNITGYKPPRTYPEWYERFAPYYFGGRVQPFKGGVFEGDFQIADINSAYPAAMMSEHPWGTDVISTKCPKDSELHLAFIELEAENLGAFPHRNKTSIDFTTERGTFYVTGHEFKTALETDTARSIKILNAVVFENSINFADYVEQFYEKKLLAERCGDKSGRLFAKLLMNSLYGKFAARPSQYREYIFDEFGAPEPEGYERGDIIYDKQIFSRPLNENEQRWYNVATAASITGQVRAFLWDSICRVDDPYYCDTDSIIFSGKSDLAYSDNLGEWSSEGHADKLAISGKKLYAAWDNGDPVKTASKGARLSAAEIERVASGETIVYEPEAPTFSISYGTKIINREIRSTF